MAQMLETTREGAQVGTQAAPTPGPDQTPPPASGGAATTDIPSWASGLGDGYIWRRLALPVTIVMIVATLLAGIGGYSLGTIVGGGSRSAGQVTASQSSGGMSGMNGGSSSTTTQSQSVPNATQDYGNQPAVFTTDASGAKHLTLTAQQVMWSPVQGQRVLAWTLDGTVPGPMIHVTSGDHLSITIINHLPEATAIHWHGLEVPMDSDGVPPLGMKPIQPGQSYTYNFTVQDQDVGTHWYHSHYDDMTQVGGGMYGAFIVDPRPGSPQAQQQPQVDQDYVEMISQLDGYFVINGKSFPDTQPLTVKRGQTIRVRLIGADPQLIHPMHMHGHTFTIIAEDGHMLAQPIQKDTVPVSPGETYDLTFYAWANAGNIYPFHCHILSHVMNPGQTGSEMGGLIVLIKYE